MKYVVEDQMIKTFELQQFLLMNTVNQFEEHIQYNAWHHMQVSYIKVGVSVFGKCATEAKMIQFQKAWCNATRCLLLFPQCSSHSGEYQTRHSYQSVDFQHIHSFTVTYNSTGNQNICRKNLKSHTCIFPLWVAALIIFVLCIFASQIKSLTF